jgi:hypothetical protein
MAATPLEHLTSDDFVFSLGFLHTPANVRRRLLDSPEVKELSTSLRYGGVTEQMISEFVSSIIKDFKVGQRFAGDLALAAIAVVLEHRPTDFAQEYLHDLARIRVPFPELSISIRIARECVKNRCEVPKHQAKSFNYPGPATRRDSLTVAAKCPWGKNPLHRLVSRYPRVQSYCHAEA